MKKRIISIALVVVMIVAMIPAVLLPTAAMTSFTDGYDTAIVGENAITVDGAATPDAAYLNSEKVIAKDFNNNYKGSGESSDFESYFATDEKGLYLWVKASDPSIDKHLGYQVTEEIADPDTGDVTTQTVTKYLGKDSGDKFQIYLRTVTTSSVYVGTYEFDYVDNTVRAGKCSAEGVQLATTKSVEDKYWIGEIYIPFTSLNAALADVAFEDINVAVSLQLNNQTTVASPAHKSFCHDQRWGGTAYRGISNNNTESNNSNSSGNLSTFLNFSGFKSVVTTQNVTVDGVRDGIYDKSDDIKSYVGVGTAGEGSFVTNVVANAKGVYLFADIKDTTLDKQPWEATSMGDKLQVYFKMANRFSSISWGSFEVDYREARYDKSDFDENGELKADAVAKAAKNWANKNTTGMPGWGVDKLEYATTKVYDDEGNALGWTAELFIPWSGAILRNGISDIESIPFSIGVQTNNTGLKEGVTLTNYDAIDGNYSHRAVCYSNGGGSFYWNGNGSAASSGSLYFLPVTFVMEDDVPNQINWWVPYSQTAPTLDGDLDATYGAMVPIYSPATGELMANTYYAFTDTDVYVYMDVMDKTFNKDDKAGAYFNLSNTNQKYFVSPNADGTGRVADDGIYFGVKPSMSYKFKIKGTATDNADYTGFCVEYKIALPATEREALAAGKATTFEYGIEITDKGEANGQGFNDNNVGYYYNRNFGNVYIYDAPVYVLSKDIKAADFAVTPKIKAATVSLGESIDMNCYVDLPLNATNAQLKVTFNEKEYYLNAKKTATANEYKFVFENIAPQCIGDVIAAELIVDGKVVDAVPAELEYSVLANLKNIKNDDNAALVDALLQYGAAAQVYADYKTDALVADVDAIDVAEFKGAVKTVTAPAAGAKIVAAGVYHANVNKLYVKVEAEDIAAVKALTINGKAADLVAYKDGTYIAYTDAVKATDFGTVYTFVLEYANGDAAQTFTYNVYGYAQSIAANSYNADSVVLAKALYNYGAAAAAYVK